MRFNAKRQFNVPFCKKPERFRAAYITKITRQTDEVARLLKSHQWEIKHADWRETLGKCGKSDFVYLDPPYIGRHSDYFNSWGEEDASDLAESVKSLPCGYAISMWKENRYRANPYLAKHWEDHIIRSFHHFYFVGSTEGLRGAMEEALAIRPGFETSDGQGSFSSKRYKQKRGQMQLLGTNTLAK